MSRLDRTLMEGVAPGAHWIAVPSWWRIRPGSPTNHLWRPG